MIVRFATYEEAGIYAGWMRSEGHYAGILDENMGFFWGPLAIGGFRVCVTDAPVENEEPLPANPQREHNLLDELRLVVASIAIVVFLAIAAILIFMLAAIAVRAIAAIVTHPNMTDFLECIRWAITLVILPAVFIGLGPLMVPATRAMRDEHTLLGGLVRGLVVCYFAGYWLMMLIAFVLAIWHNSGHANVTCGLWL